MTQKEVPSFLKLATQLIYYFLLIVPIKVDEHISTEDYIIFSFDIVVIIHQVEFEQKKRRRPSGQAARSLYLCSDCCEGFVMGYRLWEPQL